MKKEIIYLSIITPYFLFGVDSANSITIQQVNKIRSNTNISNNSTIVQGKTDIKNNSDVDSLEITQKSGINAGNLIEDSTISGANSKVVQGLSSVNSSTLHNAKLNSNNTITRTDITDGESNVTQSNLIIGGNSNVYGTAEGSGGGMGIGGTADNIEITQNNLLEDTNIKKSTIHQGRTTINGGANISSTFKLNENNSITILNSNGNSSNNSTITQGDINITAGTTTNVKQNIQNIIEDIIVDGSYIKQSNINLKNSITTNINSYNDENLLDDKNKITNIVATGGSTIIQSSIDSRDSIINQLSKYDRNGVDENSWINTTYLNNSELKQSVLSAKNSSHLSNIEYTTHDSGVSSTNLVYMLTSNESNISQDITDISNSDFNDNILNRANTVNHVTAINNSHLAQFNIKVENSSLDNSNLSNQGLYYNTTVNNANLSQGSTTITD